METAFEKYLVYDIMLAQGMQCLWALFNFLPYGPFVLGPQLSVSQVACGPDFNTATFWL